MPVLLLALACRARPEAPPPLSDPDPAAGDPDVRVTPRQGQTPLQMGPGVVRPGGLVVPVPDGWVAWPGGSVEERVVLAHESGARLTVLDGGAPTEGPDCGWRFRDEVARPRRLPHLASVRTAACLPDRADVAMIEAWWGRSKEGPVRVELTLPPGAQVAGRDAAEPVLAGLGR